MTKLSCTALRLFSGWRLWLLNLFLLLAISACGSPNGTLPPPPAPPATAIGAAGNSTPAVIPTEPPTQSSDRQLLLWAPPFFNDLTEVSSATAITNVYAQFERTHPGVHIELQLKNESGNASMLNYLRGAQRLAPTILPDLILLDSQQLWQVTDLELVQTINLNQLANASEFFPFTLAAVTSGEQLFGIPYATDLIHLVYHKEQIENSPTSWANLLTQAAPYHFSTGKNEGLNEALLTQYLGAGGRFGPEDTAIDVDAVRALFTFAAEAKAAGVVSEDEFALTTLEQVWESFTTNPSSLANTSAHLILSQLDTLSGRNIGYGPIPTSSGSAQAIAHVWAFAIVTTDPVQIQLAIDLINLLLEPTVHSTWARETKYIPASPIAFDSWRTPGDYYDFLRSELEIAMALPNGRRYADFSKRLQQGYEKVVRGEMTADEAVIYVQAAP